MKIEIISPGLWVVVYGACSSLSLNNPRIPYDGSELTYIAKENRLLVTRSTLKIKKNLSQDHLRWTYVG